MSEERARREEPVEIVAHDPAWQVKFEAERSAITEALGAIALEVHHVGSTAVPGLAAKPIIDILVAVGSLEDRGALGRGLSALGYANVPHDDDGRRLFFWKGVPRAFHVHVVKLNSWTYWRHLVFRDMLVSSPELRAEYGRLKLELAGRFREDREAYTEAKGEFIERVVAKNVRGK
ncbi:MAG: hypothetical protein QG582_771 [Candidatus Thermoplasmatota archaeon]|nr:hypothetical protein [Candidatus Thermoplasmatota archaeon]